MALLLNTRRFRIDVENPAPGVRPGQLHLQDSAGGKYLFDHAAGVFDGLPPGLASHVASTPGVDGAILKGLRYLGMDG